MSEETLKNVAGVRILLANGQSIDVPLVQNLNDPAPSYDELNEIMTSQQWLTFPALNLTIARDHILLFTSIEIPLNAVETEPQPDVVSAQAPIIITP